jgi:hypothetical protein
MRRMLVYCLSFILATGLLLPCTSAGGDASAENVNSERTGPIVLERVRTGSPSGPQAHEQGGKGLITEIRRGAGVAVRSTQLRRRNKGFARAYEDMIKRGRKPLFREAGLTILGVDNSRLSVSKVAFNGTQDIIDGDREMSFFPFDSEPTVWEGLIYVRGPEGEATYAVSHDTTHSDLSQTEVYYEAYYPGDGPEVIQSVLPGRNQGSVRTVAAVSSASSAAPNMMWPRFRDWLNCSAIGCALVFEGCLYSGPFFWGCFAAGCGLVMLACILVA